MSMCRVATLTALSQGAACRRSLTSINIENIESGCRPNFHNPFAGSSGISSEHLRNLAPNFLR
jgi:hypothetical protein